jgi:intraflagellar transport protein 56
MTRAQVFPGLADQLPEARLNLIIFHLRRGDVGAAYGLVRDAVPETPQEYILKVPRNGGAAREHAERAGATGGLE